MDKLIAFLISMTPVLELRGGIVYAAARGVNFIEAFIICFVGNILPIPFVLVFLRKILDLMEKGERTRRIAAYLERHARRSQGSVEKYRILGLFMFVAIPLPGTGAYSGALIAVIMGMRIRKSLPAIVLGVLAAGLIMTGVSFYLPNLFGFTPSLAP